MRLSPLLCVAMFGVAFPPAAARSPSADGIGTAAIQSPRQGPLEAFRQAFARIHEDCVGAAAAACTSAARALDGVVITHLNSGESPEAIGRLLAALPACGVCADTDARANSVVAEWPNYRSCYTLVPIGSAPIRTWLAVYSFGQSPHGYLSVLASDRSGRWQRTDGFDAPRHLDAYPLRAADVPTVAIVDHHVMADGWSGGLELRHIVDGRLAKTGRRYDPLSRYEVRRDGDDLRVAFSRFPRCLGLDVAHLHLSSFDLVVRAQRGVAEVVEVPTSPWLVAVDDACAAVRAGGLPDIGESGSNRLCVTALGSRWAGNVLDAAGDLTAGTGSVTIETDSQTTFRFEVHRQAGGVWKIERVSSK